MSLCLPLKWLPAALPARIEAALRETLDRWAADWGAPKAAAVTARLLAAQEAPEPAHASPWGDLPKAWPGALTRALLGPAAPSTPIAQATLQRVTADLQDTLRRRFHAPASPPAFAPARVGHGGVALSFQLLDISFGFVLDLEALQAGGWLTPAPTAKLAAINAERALHELPVPLVARLGHASVSVTDVLQLRPGDVLLLAETLDVPLQVTSPGSTLQLSAHLGASAASATPARRAMRWLAS